MRNERNGRRWWWHAWIVGLGACTAWPALAEASGQEAGPGASRDDVSEAALPADDFVAVQSPRLARLPLRSDRSAEREWLVQGAQAGQGLRLVLRMDGAPGSDRVLREGWADAAGELSWSLPDDLGLQDYRIELWALAGPGASAFGLRAPASYWTGPVAQVAPGVGLGFGAEQPDMGAPQQVGGMIVTEIMKDPSAVSDASGEWIELFNPLWMRQDIEGWTLSDDGGSSTILSNGGAGIWVAGRGHRALVRRLDSTLNGGVTEAYAYSGFSLSNGADEVILARPDGTVVDRVAYDDGFRWPDTPGASLQLEPGIESPRQNDAPSRWCESWLPYGQGDLGTPGQTNGDC